MTDHQVLDSDYSFDEDGIYPSIDYNDEDPHRSYMEKIETMPMTAGPGVFGLHENANIACALAETFVIFDTIVLMEVGKLFLEKQNEHGQPHTQIAYTQCVHIDIFLGLGCSERMLV